MTHCKSRYECVFVYEFEYLPTYLSTHVFVTLSVEAYRARSTKFFAIWFPHGKQKSEEIFRPMHSLQLSI